MDAEERRNIAENDVIIRRRSKPLVLRFGFYAVILQLSKVTQVRKSTTRADPDKGSDSAIEMHVKFQPRRKAQHPSRQQTSRLQRHIGSHTRILRMS